MSCLTPCEEHVRTQKLTLALAGNLHRCTACTIGTQLLPAVPRQPSVDSSVFAMALGALTTYEFPLAVPQVVTLPGGYTYVAPASVNWNQISDRRRPSQASVTTRTKSYPTFMTPGGSGCDIKHNSYARYLNKLKGRKPLRQTPRLIPGCKFCINNVTN